MRKNIFIAFIYFAFISMCFSQYEFEKGYYITNQGEKIECLIKNLDWRSIPSKIEYKLDENSDRQTLDFTDIKSFYIYNTIHYYQKHYVDIDKNTKQEFNPIKQFVVLQVLVSGSANLYKFNNQVYFYSLGDHREVKQLVYGEYKDINNKAKKNNAYKLELYENLKCEKITPNQIRKLKYKEQMLIRLFSEYNECIGDNAVEHINSENKTETVWKINLLAGVHKNLSIQPEIPIEGMYGNAPFKTKLQVGNTDQITPAIGVEVEALLPFNKNRLSVFLSLTYQMLEDEFSQKYYNATLGTFSGITPNLGLPYTTTVKADYSIDASYNYSYIELPLGLRYYFNLNSQSKLAIEGSFGAIVLLNKKENLQIENLNIANSITFKKGDNTPLNFSSQIKLGTKYLFKDRYGLGLDYYLYKEVGSSYGSSLGIVFSYRVY